MSFVCIIRRLLRGSTAQPCPPSRTLCVRPRLLLPESWHRNIDQTSSSFLTLWHDRGTARPNHGSPPGMATQLLPTDPTAFEGQRRLCLSPEARLPRTAPRPQALQDTRCCRASPCPFGAVQQGDCGAAGRVRAAGRRSRRLERHPWSRNDESRAARAVPTPEGKK